MKYYLNYQLNVTTVKYLTIFLLFLPASCSFESNQLQHVQWWGVMRVALLPYTHLSAARKQFDIALIQSFAKQLGVRAEFINVADSEEMLDLLVNKKVHFTIVHSPLHDAPQLRKTPHYLQLNYYLVQHQKKSSINLEQLLQTIYLSKNIIYQNITEQLNEQYLNLHWQYCDKSNADLLMQLNQQRIVFTDSKQLTEIWHFFPHLSIAATVSEQKLHWGFLQKEDNSLYQAATNFIKKAQYLGELEKLRQYYYGELTEVDNFNAFNIYSFYKNIKQRLVLYRHHFELEALKRHLDWRLIAAVGYEESLWNPEAVSATGVRGLMMLTEDTADYLGVEDRNDPIQSISGGARYLKKLYSRLPKEIKEPDRTWFMLASYNMGYGHVMDARKLAQTAGFNPNYWGIVKKYALLLSEPKWYKKTKYGKARGHEAVEYVRRIRLYYTMLKFIDEKHISEKIIYLSNGYKTFPYQSVMDFQF